MARGLDPKVSQVGVFKSESDRGYALQARDADAAADAAHQHPPNQIPLESRLHALFKFLSSKRGAKPRRRRKCNVGRNSNATRCRAGTEASLMNTRDMRKRRTRLGWVVAPCRGILSRKTISPVNTVLRWFKF